VTVNNDLPPNVTLEAPAEGATVSGAAVMFSATASDDGQVDRVEFFVDDVYVGQDADPAGGWTYVWNSNGVGDGDHAIRARAVDDAAQTANDTNTVSVDNADEAPGVTLDVPAAGTTVRGTVGLSATASDDRGLTVVEFFVDDVSVGQDADPAGGWTASWDTTAAIAGAHTVTAVATDSIGQTANDANTVTVDNDGPASLVTSPDGRSPIAGQVTVTATADADTASVTFYLDGSTAIGTDANAAGGWSVPWNTVGVPNGPHGLTAVATDAVGNVGSASPAVTVTVDNPLIVEVRIAASSDDAEQRPNTGMTLTSSDLDMMTDGATVLPGVGLRFTQIAVPQGATIVDAYLRFTTDEVHTTTTSLRIEGHDVDNAGTFTTTKNNLLSRVRTTEYVQWSVPYWAARGASGADQTATITNVVQELVDRPGWTPNNAIALIITGSGRRVARSFDNGTGDAPLLHIEYEL
jgi:hypothetical protein